MTQVERPSGEDEVLTERLERWCGGTCLAACGPAKFQVANAQTEAKSAFLMSRLFHFLELPFDSMAPIPEMWVTHLGVFWVVGRTRAPPILAGSSERLCPTAPIPRTMKAAGSAPSLSTRWIPGRMPTPRCCPRRKPATSTRFSVSDCTPGL